MNAQTAPQLAEWHRRHGEVFSSAARDPAGLQNLLRLHDGIIGGSTAVLFFYPQASFTPPNIDIFVPSEGEKSIVDFFKQEEYGVDEATLLPIAHAALPDEKSLVVTYGAGIQKVTRLRRGSDVVNVFTSIGRATEPLSYMWTTLLMCFLTPDGACCAYPTLTSIGRGLYHSGRILSHTFPSGDALAVNKYCERRGFELAAHPTNWFTLPPGPEPCDRGCECPLTLRRFGDAGCFNLRFTAAALNPHGSQWVFGGITEDFHAAVDSM
ncbi:hypothetical protein C8Q78DRAFT_988914 [Trametes maxima]|nr:hypothetical protein C8Q78DRAFT_988914 [Trametes maxima]